MSNNKPEEAGMPMPMPMPADPQPKSQPNPVDVSPEAHEAIHQEFEIAKRKIAAAQGEARSLGRSLAERDKEVLRLNEELATSMAHAKSVNNELTALERELQSVKAKHKDELTAMKHELQEAFTASRVQGAAMFNIKKQLAIHENSFYIHERNSASIERLTKKIK